MEATCTRALQSVSVPSCEGEACRAFPSGVYTAPRMDSSRRSRIKAMPRTTLVRALGPGALIFVIPAQYGPLDRCQQQTGTEWGGRECMRMQVWVSVCLENLKTQYVLLWALSSSSGSSACALLDHPSW